MKVTLAKLPDNENKSVIVFKIPKSGKLHISKLAEVKNYKKSCDYFILSEKNKEVDILLIELKSTHINNEAYGQILCTVPIMEYLISMAQIHFDVKKNIQMHYVVIAEKFSDKIGKQIIKITESCIPKTIKYKDKKYKIFYSDPKIHFNKLISSLLNTG